MFLVRRQGSLQSIDCPRIAPPDDQALATARSWLTALGATATPMLAVAGAVVGAEMYEAGAVQSQLIEAEIRHAVIVYTVDPDRAVVIFASGPAEALGLMAEAAPLIGLAAAA